jgi:hypothetical protein
VRRGDARTDRRALSRFRTALDRLHNPPNGPVGCPADTGGEALEIFTDGAHVTELDESLTGCQSVTNGTRTGRIGTSNVGTTLMRRLPAGFRCAVWNRFGRCPRAATAER